MAVLTANQSITRHGSRALLLFPLSWWPLTLPSAPGPLPTGLGGPSGAACPEGQLNVCQHLVLGEGFEAASPSVLRGREASLAG